MKLLRFLLGRGCSHRFSWPRIDGNGHYYQVCPDCGITYAYDWTLMKRTERLVATARPTQ